MSASAGDDRLVGMLSDREILSKPARAAARDGIPERAVQTRAGVASGTRRPRCLAGGPASVHERYRVKVARACELPAGIRESAGQRLRLGAVERRSAQPGEGGVAQSAPIG
jgi:hypothetical protein